MPVNESKKQFAARLARKGVSSKAEIERRWLQHSGTPSRIAGRGDYSTRIPLRPARIAGRGDYRSVARTAGRLIPKGTFRSGGRMLGNYLGGGTGGELGALGGSILSRLTGMGDYSVSHNSVMASAETTGHDSSFSSTGSSVVRVKRRECVGQVIAPDDPGVFNVTRHRIQASNTELFPWGGVIAGLYQEYEIKGCVFTLESTYSNYSAAGALGSVVMATQYNASDRPFQEIESMLNSAFRTSGNPSQTIVHGLECDPKLQSSAKLLVRGKSNAGMTQAPNNYDFGFLSIATEGLPTAAANAQIGRLYVTYDIEFSLPKLKDDVVAIAERMSAGWGFPKSFSDTFISTTVLGNNISLRSPCSLWNFGGIASGSGPATTTTVSGAVTNTNDSSELSIGPVGSGEAVILMEPTTTGDNLVTYSETVEGDGEMLAWVCGTLPDVASQACHFNFRYGGYITLTIELGCCLTTAVPVPDDWWIPQYTIAGGDDIVWSTTMPQKSIDVGSSKVLTGNTVPGTAAHYSTTISATVHFHESAPSRVLSIFSNGITANVNTQWMLPNAPGVPGSFLASRFEITFMGGS